VDACLEIKEDTSEADIESSLGDSDAGDTDSESGDYSKRDSALESTSDQCSISDGNDEKLENPETDSGHQESSSDNDDDKTLKMSMETSNLQTPELNTSAPPILKQTTSTPIHLTYDYEDSDDDQPLKCGAKMHSLKKRAVSNWNLKASRTNLNVSTWSLKPKKRKMRSFLSLKKRKIVA